jgi:hypothetical protein
MRKVFLVAAFAAALGACAAAPHQIVDRSDFLAEATRLYQGETTERVIDAAQRVIRQSDPKNVEFRNTLNGFAALRRYFVYAVVASARGREKWEFTADRDPSGAIKAGLTISDAGEVYGNGRTPYENAMVSVPLYRLFWSRVEYVLGRSNDWPTCEDAEAELKKTDTNTVAGLGGLCGPTSAGRDAEPPEQLAPLAKPTPAPVATPKREKPKQS